MRLARQIRLVALSLPKQGFFLKSLAFPVTFTIDLDRFAKLYATMYSDSAFRSSAEKKLQDNMQVFLQSFSAEYDFHALEEDIAPFNPPYLYTCTYNDANLRGFIDSLLLNAIRARILIVLIPHSKQWLLSFLVASDVEIKHVLTPFFSKIRELNPRAYEKALSGKLINPKLLTKLTLPIVPGIDEISGQILQVPSKYTVVQADAIEIGKIVHPLTGNAIVDALLPIQRINQHVGILATTGAGKTNLCYQIVIQLHENNIPVLIFDWKRDYRSLKKLINAEVYDFVGNNLFTFNPLKPSGDPSQWVKEIANIMAEVISGGIYASGAFSVYVDILDQLYRTNGVYDGSTAYPTIFEVMETLETYSRKSDLSDRQRNWVASASKLFKSLAVGKTREAFSVREGISLDEILSKAVVIELDGLGDQKAKAFFISVLLQKIRNHRMQKRDRDTLKHVIVIEEAQNCLAAKEEASTTITTTYREIRSLCEGIISITQMPSELSKDAIANTNTFFVLKLVHRDDKLAACNLLGINPKDMTVIEGLEVGTCLMKTDDLCLVKIPWVEKPIVNDSDIEREVPEREEVSADFARRTDVENRADDLNEREWLVLDAIAESTAYNNTTLMNVLKYSNTDVNKIIFTLINKGFVRYRMAKKKGPGRKQKIYFLFPYGEEAYRQKHGVYPDVARIGMVDCPHTHTDMKEMLVDRIGKPTMPHNRFDIIIRSDNWEYPIEIETGSNRNQQISINIEKSIEEFGEAYFIVSDRRMYHAVLQLCANYHFTKKKDFSLGIARFDDFMETGEWDRFEYS